MSWVGTSQGGTNIPPAPPDLEEISDEELLKHLWQQAEDYTERRKIRARMYKLREQRLREMVQNDEESLGALVTTQEGDAQTAHETSETEMSISGEQPARKSSNIEVTMLMTGNSAITDNVSLQNLRLGGITMRGAESPTQGESPRQLSDEEIIDGRIKEVSKERTARYHKTLDDYNNKKDAGDDTVVSLTKSTYSIQSNALTGDSFQSMKHKEIRDSISPTRYDRKTPTYDSDGKFPSEDEAQMKLESESVIEALNSGGKDKIGKTSKAKTNPKTSSDSESSSSRPSSTSPIRKNKLSTAKRASNSRATPQSKSTPKTTTSRTSSTRKTKMDDVAKRMDDSLKNEYSKLDYYLSGAIDHDDELIQEEEEEAMDNSGNVVKMVVQTRKKKDGTEYSSRRVARSTKIVEKESDIDEILIGNPDHQVITRNIEEKEEKDGSKIKIITELRRRPDGIEYTTKNVLKTSKIFDYDHPEEITYCESDELIDSKEEEETDEQGTTIRTVTETRRKPDGAEYTTKKVFKTLKVTSQITPSDDDEIIETKESEEMQEDGTIIKTVIQKRRTRNGEEYTHRQVYRTRRMTLSGIDLQKGLPMMDNDDKVLDKTEKEEIDEQGKKIKVVTETRRRADGSTYSFEYVLRSFKTTESEIEKMPLSASPTSGIAVNPDDKLIKEDVKEEVQKDGSIIKTIIERRRAKDGTEYLRHRIMRIPKLPEPKLQVGSFDDEILEENVKERVLEDGTHCRSITERRKSSVTGMQYTLRRMSKLYQPAAQQVQSDEIIDENVTEEETADGILVKTVIRRYQRPDGNVYTTHDVHRTYKTPVPVMIDQREDDNLVDRSYDERETSDGYIIKTIMETRCRSDGLHYTVERVEKISKYGPEIQFSFKGDSISGGGPGDTVVSREEHEEPNEQGVNVKTILEVRRRQDSTEYTNKTTIRSTEVLVPEHETSYVVIKPDDDHGFMPSLDDKVIYTRQREEVDEKGNVVTVIIETRESKATGEKYNLTKKVHTTDVLVTDQGEKILSKKSKAPLKSKPSTQGKNTRSGSEHDVPYGSVSALKNRFSSPKKAETNTKTVNMNRANTASKKMFFEEAATKSATTKASLKSEHKVPLSDYLGTSKQTNLNSLKQKEVKAERNEPSEALKKRTSLSPIITEREKPVFHKKDEKKKPDSVHTLPSKSPQSSSDERTSPKLRKISPDSSSDERAKTRRRAKPETSSDEMSKKPKAPLTNKRSIKESPTRKSPIEKSPRSGTPTRSSPMRSRSPIKSDGGGSREVTPYGGRQCCKRAKEEQEQETLAKDRYRVRKYPQEKPSMNGISKRVSNFESPEANLKNKKPDTYKEGSPKLADKTSPKSRDTRDYSKQPQRPKSLNPPKEPVVSLPQTPLVEDLKAYPTGNESPIIEDVSSEPNLPSHAIHRPSLVREPSESYAPDSTTDSAAPYYPTKGQASSSEKSNQKVARKRNIDKPLFEKAPSLSDEFSLSSTDKSRTTRNKTERLYRKRSSVSSGDEDTKTKSRPRMTKLSDMKPADKRQDKKSPEIDSRKPFSDSRKLKDWEKSLFSQIEPTENKIQSRKSSIESSRKSSIESTRKSSFESKEAISSKRSIFEKENTSKIARGTDKRVPVKEPICVKRHSYKCGEDDETLPPEQPEDATLKSTKLVMKTMSPEPKGSDISSRRATQLDTRRSISPSSKEPSPAPFSKEGSPSHFVTGRPVDLGVNPNKIKKLERSNSNKKFYEDFEETATQFVTFSREVESITDIIVLEKMLEKLDSYEERRIVRGKIRSLRKPLSSKPTTTDRSSVSRFITPTRDFQKTPRREPAKPSAFTDYNKKKPLDNSERVSLGSSSYKTTETDSGFSSIRKYNETTREKEASRRLSVEKEKDEKYSDFVARKNLRNKQEQSRSEEKHRRLSQEKESSEKQVRKTSIEKETIRQTRKTSTESTTRRTSIEKRSEREVKSHTTDTTASEDEARRSKYDQRSTSVKDTATSSVRKTSVEKEERKSSTQRETRKVSVESDSKNVTTRSQIKDTKSSDEDKKKSKTKTRLEATPKLTTTEKKQTSVTTRTADLHSSYSEPLRHQRTPVKPTHQSQSDVDKIISPYGVGPTDENGIPLIGLRALRKKKQVAGTKTISTKEPEKTAEFEPSDSQGRPLFGIKALKKSPPESTAYTATHMARETASVDAVSENASLVTEKQNLSTGIVTQQTTHATSSALVRSVDDSVKVTATESDEEATKVKLKDIIQLHESKANEPLEPRSVSPEKPKQKLRESFEPTVETTENRMTRTWDMRADLSTRSDAVGNIIAKHETLTQKESVTTTKPEKKLTGILKKTSTSSISPSKVTDDEFTSPDEHEPSPKAGRKTSHEKSPQPAQLPDDERPKEIKRKTSYTEIVLSPSAPPEGKSEKKLRTDKKYSKKTETYERSDLKKTSARTKTVITITKTGPESSPESSSSTSVKNKKKGKKSSKDKTDKDKLRTEKTKIDQSRIKSSISISKSPTHGDKSSTNFERSCACPHREKEEHAYMVIESTKALHAKRQALKTHSNEEGRDSSSREKSPVDKKPTLTKKPSMVRKERGVTRKTSTHDNKSKKSRLSQKTLIEGVITKKTTSTARKKETVSKKIDKSKQGASSLERKVTKTTETITSHPINRSTKPVKSRSPTKDVPMTEKTPKSNKTSLTTYDIKMKPQPERLIEKSHSDAFKGKKLASTVETNVSGSEISTIASQKDSVKAIIETKAVDTRIKSERQLLKKDTKVEVASKISSDEVHRQPSGQVLKQVLTTEEKSPTSAIKEPKFDQPLSSPRKVTEVETQRKISATATDKTFESEYTSDKTTTTTTKTVERVEKDLRLDVKEKMESTSVSKESRDSTTTQETPTKLKPSSKPTREAHEERTKIKQGTKLLEDSSTKSRESDAKSVVLTDSYVITGKKDVKADKKVAKTEAPRHVVTTSLEIKRKDTVDHRESRKRSIEEKKSRKSSNLVEERRKERETKEEKEKNKEEKELHKEKAKIVRKQPFITDVRVKEWELRENLRLAHRKNLTSEDRVKRRSLTTKTATTDAEDLAKRVRKLSKRRSVENLESINEFQSKMKDTRTYSLQSLSGASTTSSVPSYMRPKGEGSRRRQTTPERDPQEIEDILLNSYLYTRCTKRIFRPPVSYDYVYTVHKGDAAAGDASNSYSIYFGPRVLSPAKESRAVDIASTDHRATTYCKIGEEYDSLNRASLTRAEDESHVDDVEIRSEDLITEEKESNANTNDEYEKIIRKYSDTQSHIDLSRKESLTRNEAASRMSYPIYSSVEIISDDSNTKESTYPEIRQQYLDTVKSIDKNIKIETSHADTKEERHTDSFSAEEVKSESHTKDMAFFKERDIELRKRVEPEIDYGSRDFPKPEIFVTGDTEYDSSTDRQKMDQVTSLESTKKMNHLSTKASSTAFKEIETSSKYNKEELQQKYNYQVENKMADYYKMETKRDFSRGDASQSVSTVKHKEMSENQAHLMDYDFNKIYADKVSKQTKLSSDSDFEKMEQRKDTIEELKQEELKKRTQLESSTQIESENSLHAESHHSEKSQSFTTDEGYYVTFDGRVVPSPRVPTREMTSDAITKELETTGGAQSSVKLETSSSATIAHDSSSAFRSVQRSSSGRRIRGYESVEPIYQEQLQYNTQGSALELSSDMPDSGKSFLEDHSKVSGISDVLTRMSASQAVDHDSRVSSDAEAKSLLNKFLGAQVLMTGVESMMANAPASQMAMTRSASGSQMSSVTKDGVTTEQRSHFSTGPQSITLKGSSTVQQSSSPKIKGVNIDEVTDSFELNQLLDSCEEYEERKRIRMRLKALMADNSIDEELRGHVSSHSSKRAAGTRAATLGSKGVNSLSSEASTRTSEIRGTTHGVSQKTTNTIQSKTDSPFNKFKQLDAQHPKYSTSGSKPANSGPLFQLSTSLNRSASGVKDMILMWCQCRTRDYKGVKIDNFSTSWNDGLAFCALIHHFFPDAFNFDSLDPKNRRYNFSLAFRVADEKAGVYPLLDVDDMVMMQKPDWKCVFTYVQALYKTLKDE